jgi:putative ABC transport system permease protein
MTTANRPDELLDRWRREVRRALPDADPGLIEEVALHLADRWAAVCSSACDAAAADAAVFADLDAWRLRTLVLQGRAPWWTRLVAGLFIDVAVATRRLAVRPVATAGAALLIAIALGANVAAFAIARGVLWRPLAYPAADRLVTLWQFDKGETVQISYPDFADLRRNGSLDAGAALSAGVGTLVTGEPGVADRVQAVEAEPALFAMLGATPALGRLLTADDGGKPFAMISHRLWQSRFGAEAAVIGRSFALSGRAYTIVGVLPAGFDLELPVSAGFTLDHADIWTSLDSAFPFVTRRDVSAYEAIARLAPGVTLDLAQHRADATAAVLQRDFAATNKTRGFRLIPLRDRLVERARQPLVLAGLGALTVALIALANLTTLALGRLGTRQAELAVRRSLGASSWRITRQLVIDDLPIAIAGATVGIASAAALVRVLISSRTAHVPRPEAIAIDLSVVLFAAALCVVLWLAPALAALRLLERRHPSLRADARVVGRAARQARRALVAGEVALALVLATGAALLSLALARLVAVDPGFSTRGTLTLRVSAYASRYPTRDDVTAFFARVSTEIGQLPGVDRASASSSLPLSGNATGTSVMSAEEPRPPAERLSAGWDFTRPGYFHAAGMPIERGRDFAETDLARAGHVTVLNRSAARALFGAADPIGRRVSIGGGEASGDWHEVIGVVGDVRHVALADDPTPHVYDLLGQHWGRTMYLVVRARPGLDAGSLESPVRHAIAAINPDAPIFEVATVETLVGRSAASRRLAAALGGGLALMALVLALLGTFAVVACSVTERLRELGVRIALGATSKQVVGMILREALVTAAAGCLAGLAGSLVVVRVLAGQLFGVRVQDAIFIVPLLALTLAAASVIAAWWPARRASRADPIAALRTSA